MNIRVRQLTSNDSEYFAEGIELLNRTQGRDLFPKDYLHLRTQDPKSFVVGAFDNDTLVSVGIAQLIENYDYFLPFDSGLYEKFKNTKVGLFSTLCVHESYQGKGIGQMVSRKRLEWLKGHNCDVILGVSWVSGLAHTSNRVFEKMGFKAIGTVEKFYVSHSLKNPFECPGCHTHPCQCGAILYWLEL